MESRIESLLNMPYSIIDILPCQVPRDSAGQYFRVEKFFLGKTEIAEIKRKHLNVILKLNCYRDLSLEEEGKLNPAPDETAEAVLHHSVHIMMKDMMLVSEPDETYMTLFNPDNETLELVKMISAGEGLFVWKPEEKD